MKSRIGSLLILGILAFRAIRADPTNLRVAENALSGAGAGCSLHHDAWLDEINQCQEKANEVFNQLDTSAENLPQCDKGKIFKDIRNSYFKVKRIFDQKCFSCHGEGVKRPIYSLGKYLGDRDPIQNERDQARNQFVIAKPSSGFIFRSNVSKSRVAILRAIQSEVQTDNMPPFLFKRLRSGGLTETEKKEMIDWTNRSIKSLNCLENVNDFSSNPKERVQSLLEQRCILCHTPGASGANKAIIKGFESLKTENKDIQNSLLCKVIKQIQIKKMPPGSDDVFDGEARQNAIQSLLELDQEKGRVCLGILEQKSPALSLPSDTKKENAARVAVTEKKINEIWSKVDLSSATNDLTFLDQCPKSIDELNGYRNQVIQLLQHRPLSLDKIQSSLKNCFSNDPPSCLKSALDHIESESTRKWKNYFLDSKFQIPRVFVENGNLRVPENIDGLVIGDRYLED